jgi:RimJ/RimL family protein N-acetyltransferase
LFPPRSFPCFKYRKKFWETFWYFKATHLKKGKQEETAMFGFTMNIKHKEMEILLRAPKKQEMPLLVPGFSSQKIQMNTSGTSARTEEDETEWYEKQRTSQSGITWFIVPKEFGQPVGVTSLERIDFLGACMSGIIIWDSHWWGKGVATCAHLGRTLYAADYLNRLKIDSCVRVGNPGSFKALERVGYTIWGTEPRQAFRQGKWLDTYHLIWLHPEKVNLLYPEGVPQCFNEGLNKAQIALALAREIVKFP